jgi:fermentation-respiration switch protein FrsA (DUF1100 family)
MTRKSLTRLLRTAALVYLGAWMMVGGGVMLFENRLIYFPTRHPAGDWRAPERDGRAVEDVWLQTDDGVRIHGWYLPTPGAPVTLLFFHGNAGNLSDRYDWANSLSQLPAHVLLMDYRGYGRSEGRPDEAGLYRDAEAAYRWLVDEKGTPGDRIVLYGKSLGGAPACEIASRFPVGGLILQSTFTSAADMASIMFPLFPVGSLLKTRFDNEAKIRGIRVPKLLIHSRDDEMLPYRMAERLYEVAPEPRQLQSYDGAGHNDLISRRGAELAEGISAWLATWVP